MLKFIRNHREIKSLVLRYLLVITVFALILLVIGFISFLPIILITVLVIFAPLDRFLKYLGRKGFFREEKDGVYFQFNTEAFKRK